MTEDEKRKMHIVYLTNEFITDTHKPVGGLATYLNNISAIMKDKGHKVTIIVLSEKNQEFYYRNKIRVINIKARTAKGHLSDFGRALLAVRNSWKMYITLKKLHREDTVDIVQAANCRAVGFFRSYRIPTILRASSDSALWRNANLTNFNYDQAVREKKWVDRVELFCIRHADGAFAPSKCCADILTKRSGRRLQVVESPYQRQDIQLDDSVYKEKLNGKKYLLFNSSLSLLKGTHLVIRATERILTAYPDLYLVYAGTDNGLGLGKCVANVLKEQHEKYHGRVIYLHKLEHKQLFPVIEHAWACVLPSRIDNLPNSCIEAMELGKIVIGTYGASFEQLITNKENGLLIKRDSEKALVKAVNYLMHLTEEEHQEMGEKAKETIRRLEPDIIYESLMKYYESVIEAYRSKKFLQRLL